MHSRLYIWIWNVSPQPVTTWRVHRGRIPGAFQNTKPVAPQTISSPVRYKAVLSEWAALPCLKQELSASMASWQWLTYIVIQSSPNNFRHAIRFQ